MRHGTSLLHFDLYLVGQRPVADGRVCEHLERVGAIGQQVSNRRQPAALHVVHRPQRYRQIGRQRVEYFVALQRTRQTPTSYRALRRSFEENLLEMTTYSN